jgi:ribosomal protein S18 acetylase RimI-like enzyme
MTNRFEVALLTPSRDRSSFTCGVAALDTYFRQQAGQDARRRLVAVFVLLDREADTIAGFYTLSATAVQPSNLPDNFARRLARYAEFPASLIGRLAVDQRYQHQGLGELLLLNALRRALENTEHMGAVAVVVDAKDDASRAFYERYGFLRLKTEPYRLFIPMRAIATMRVAE